MAHNQSDIESQSGVSELYVPKRSLMPNDYPDAPAPTLKRALYTPWKRRLPRSYPQGRAPNIQPQTRLDLPNIKRGVDKRERPGATKAKPFVLSTFDARPINAIDFLDTFTATEQVAGDTFTCTYAVPEGRVAVFRNLALRVYMSAASRDAVTGQPTEAITLSFLVNGAAVEQVNNIRVDDAICTPAFQVGLNLPLYFLAPPSATVSLILSNTAGGTQIAFAAPLMSGTLLQAEGVNPTSEPGTHAPLPVR